MAPTGRRAPSLSNTSIITTRQAIAVLLQPAVGLPVDHVTAYPPKPLNRPCVYVDTVQSGDGATMCGPELSVTIYVAAAGDEATQLEALDGYVEQIWNAIGASTRYAPVSFVPVSIEEAVIFPAYRITVTAPL